MPKSIKLFQSENVLNPDGTVTKRVVLLSDTAPASTAISGADVEGLNDDDVIAAGSVLITPGANYIAFADGVFTKKE